MPPEGRTTEFRQNSLNSAACSRLIHQDMFTVSSGSADARSGAGAAETQARSIWPGGSFTQRPPAGRSLTPFGVSVPKIDTPATELTDGGLISRGRRWLRRGKCGLLMTGRRNALARYSQGNGRRIDASVRWECQQRRVRAATEC